MALIKAIRNVVAPAETVHPYRCSDCSADFTSNVPDLSNVVCSFCGSSSVRMRGVAR